jgi:hypothetical protein
MLRIDFPEDLKKTLEQLDDQWVEDVIKQLPFPIAYPLHRAKQEGYPWHQVLKDLLNAILQYLALLAVSEYIGSSDEPDDDINKEIQERIGRGISEGQWLSFVRICVKKRENQTKIPILTGIYHSLEETHQVKIHDEDFNINTDKIGLISAWIKLRNLSAHSRELSEKVQKERLNTILNLVKIVTYLLEPIGKYHYCQHLKGKNFAGIFDLIGVTGFKEVSLDIKLEEKQGCLIIDENKKAYLLLYPLYISYKNKKGILIEKNDVYLINTIEREKPSQYMSPSGNFIAPKEMKEPVINYFMGKRVYEKRQDKDLGKAYQHGQQVSQRIIEDLTRQGLYLPGKYVERETFKKDMEEFLSSGKKAVIISGESGSGKTSALIHFSRQILKKEELVLLVRCDGLPAAAVNPDKLERTLTEELEYKGKFEEIINWFEKEKKRFYLIFESLNEFVGPGKDLSRIFDSVNALLSRYKDKRCLQIIISTTSESAPYFLNQGNNLPDSMEEEKDRYYQGEAGYIYLFKKFSPDELKQAAARYDVPFWAVEEVSKNSKIDLMNPRQFRIFAELFHGKVGEEMAGLKKKEKYREIVKEIVKYSDYKLYHKHLNKVLERDKKLMGILEEMARFMDKQKDLSPTWRQYVEKNPQLARQLSENNWERLSRLKELQLVKEDRIAGSEGIGEWKLSFAHDKVYDFLTKKVDRKIFIHRLKIYGTLSILFGTILLLMLLNYKSGAPSEIDIDNSVKWNTQHLGPVSHESIKAYKEFLIFEYVQDKKVFHQLLILTFILYFLFLFGLFLFSTGEFKIISLAEKLFGKKPDSRIKYMYRDFVVKRNIKMINKFLLSLFVILMSAIIYGRFTKSFTLLIIVALSFISISFLLFSTLRDFNVFIKNSRSKSLFLYQTDKSAVKTNTILFLYGTISTGLFMIILYSSLYLLPRVFKKIDFDYLDGGNPGYGELIEKKWVSQELIDKKNDEIKKIEDRIMNSSRVIKDLTIRIKLKLFLLVFWIYYTIVFSIDIIHPFYLRKKLGPYFR